MIQRDVIPSKGRLRNRICFPSGENLGEKALPMYFVSRVSFESGEVLQIEIEVIALVLGKDHARHVGREGGIVVVAKTVRDLRVACTVGVDGADLVDLPACAGEHDPPAERRKGGGGGREGSVGWDGSGRGDLLPAGAGGRVPRDKPGPARR